MCSCTQYFIYKEALVENRSSFCKIQEAERIEKMYFQYYFYH